MYLTYSLVTLARFTYSHNSVFLGSIGRGFSHKATPRDPRYFEQRTRSKDGLWNGINSVRYELVGGRGLETGVENLSLKYAGNPKDVGPFFHTTARLDIRVYELY